MDKNTLILDRCPNPLQREFYLRATARFGWTRRVLDHQIDNQTYEKYLLNQTSFDNPLPQAIAAQAKLAVKDHYTFDFLEHSDAHEERELETALIANVQKFLTEHKGKMEFYLVALNEQVKLPGENDAIGIIICKSKKKSVVEYALKTTDQPIGIATYSLASHLPAAYQHLLQSEEEIRNPLQGWEGEQKE